MPKNRCGEFVENVEQAFAELRLRGIEAQQNWEDCQSCGNAAMASMIETRKLAVRGYVFNHAQDVQWMKDEPEQPSSYFSWTAWDDDATEAHRPPVGGVGESDAPERATS